MYLICCRFDQKNWSFLQHFQETPSTATSAVNSRCVKQPPCMLDGWVWDETYCTLTETEYIYSLQRYEPHVNFTTLLQAQWKTTLIFKKLRRQTNQLFVTVKKKKKKKKSQRKALQR